MRLALEMEEICFGANQKQSIMQFMGTINVVAGFILRLFGLHRASVESVQRKLKLAVTECDDNVLVCLQDLSNFSLDGFDRIKKGLGCEFGNVSYRENLMQQLIPRFIAEKYEQQETEGHFEAVTMFLDISGFTAMTESLMTHGKEGAEVLAQIINRIFEPVIETVYQGGGFISTFAGDAFTAVFLKVEKPESVLACCRVIRDIFLEKGMQLTKFGDFHLRVKMGLSYGKVDWGIISGGRQKTFFFRGEAIDGAALSEHHCSSMDIVADKKIIQKCQNVEFEPVTPDHSRFIRSAERFIPQKTEPKVIAREVLQAFVPNQILEQEFSGEFREIISVFISFQEPDSNEALERLVTQLLEINTLYGGFLEGLDFGDKGTNALFIFGIPQTYENLVNRALDFILAVQSKSVIPLRAGINSGTVYAGIKGSRFRNSYGVLGRVVNLSARLMMKARWGELLLSHELKKIIPAHYDATHYGNFPFKGFQEKLPVYQLRSRKSHRVHFSFSSAFIGRETELRQLGDMLKALDHQRFGGLIVIDGSAGIGKSRFISEFCQQAPYNCLFLPCDEILRKAFNPFIYFLRPLFGLGEKLDVDLFSKNYEHFLKGFEDDVSQTELRRYKAVFAALLSLEWPDSWFDKLDAKGKYLQQQFAIKTLIVALSRRKALILIIEDAHWLDSDSHELLKLLLRNVENEAFAVLLLSRPNDDGSLWQFFKPGELSLPLQRLFLQAFDKQKMTELILARLSAPVIPDETGNFIWEKSGGNPFFIEQILLYLQENQHIDDEYRLKSTDSAIPSGIHQIIIARIDRLSARMRETVKTASVLGREFSLKVLERILETIHLIEGKSEVEAFLETGSQEQIWENLNELNYIFKHALIRDAAYELQLRESLRRLHQLAGQVIEEIYAGNLKNQLEALANHYVKAENREKALAYLEKAAHQAEKNYQNEKALGFWTTMLTFLDETMDLEQSALVRLERGGALKILARWNEALDDFEKALTISEKLSERKMEIRILTALGELLRQRGDEMPRAMALADRAIFLAEKLDAQALLSEAVGLKANVLWMQGEYEAAKENYFQQIKINEAINDEAGVSLAYGYLGYIANEQSEYEKALDFLEKRKTFCEKLGDKIGLSKAIGAIGIIHKNRGYFSVAMECYRRQIALDKETGNLDDYHLAYGNLAILYQKLGEYEKALANFDMALKICQEMGNTICESYTYGNMGVALKYLGRIDEAMAAYQMQLDLSRKFGLKRGESNALGNMGNVYRNRGDFDLAMNYYLQQIEILKKLGDRNTISATMENIAVIYEKKGDYDKALESYQQRLMELEKFGDQRGICNTLTNIANHYFLRGELDKALKTYDRQIPIAQAMQSSNYILTGYGNLALIYEEKGDFEKAVDYSQKALALCRKSGDKSYLVETLNNATNLYIKLGRMEEAKTMNLEALALVKEQKIAESHFFALKYFYILENNLSGLEKMLADDKYGEAEKADLHYEIWKRNQDEKNRVAAAKIYRELSRKTPNRIYSHRAKELDGV
jgi:tetratricopeptide (TPR) repeat protein/class 3 adenylate cyclase